MNDDLLLIFYSKAAGTYWRDTADRLGVNIGAAQQDATLGGSNTTADDATADDDEWEDPTDLGLGHEDEIEEHENQEVLRTMDTAGFAVRHLVRMVMGIPVGSADKIWKREISKVSCSLRASVVSILCLPRHRSSSNICLLCRLRLSLTGSSSSGNLASKSCARHSAAKSAGRGPSWRACPPR